LLLLRLQALSQIANVGRQGKKKAFHGEDKRMSPKTATGGSAAMSEIRAPLIVENEAGHNCNRRPMPGFY